MKFTALAALALPLLANAKGPALGPDGAELRGDPSRPNTVIENGPPGTVSLKPLCSGRGENGYVAPWTMFPGDLGFNER